MALEKVLIAIRLSQPRSIAFHACHRIKSPGPRIGAFEAQSFGAKRRCYRSCSAVAILEYPQNSILRDAVEFVAHAHWMLTDPELQKTWLSKNDDEAALKAFKEAFEHSKKERVFKGLDELHKTWKDLSETGSHATINAMVDRFVQVEDDKTLEFKLNYTGVADQRMWVMMVFGMLLTCWTMLEVFLSDYDARLKFDDTLMKMRGECDRVKEGLREMLKVRYKIEPPGGVHPAPKPVIFRP